jgi:hypothetical protein
LPTPVKVNPEILEGLVTNVNPDVSTGREDPTGMRADVAVGDVKVCLFTVTVKDLDSVIPA